jgi:3-oxoacyl-[acyl-carrier-protein] synthase III
MTDSPITIAGSRGSVGAKIVGLGHFRPEQVVTNEDFARRLNTNDEWIRTRVGISERHFAGPDDTVSSMGAIAARSALAEAGMSPADIDTVIVATCTLEAQIPHASTQVAAALGIHAPGSFDLNAACAGFCYGLAVAAHAVRCGDSRAVLLIGSERLSSWVDQDDRSNAIIFADGAGAAVVGPVAEAADEPGIGPVHWGSDGDLADKIYIKDRDSFIIQEGQAVFRWATSALAPIAIKACEKAGVKPSELAAFIPHQANLRIVEAIARKIGAPQAIVAQDIVNAGNTSSASIPLALSRMIERGEVASGSKALLLGFGAGMCYAAQVITVP